MLREQTVLIQFLQVRQQLQPQVAVEVVLLQPLVMVCLEVQVEELLQVEVDLLLVEMEIHLQQIQCKEWMAEQCPRVLVQTKELVVAVVL